MERKSIIKHISDVTVLASETMHKQQAGEVNYLKTHYPPVNKILGGGFYFGQNYLIAGMSGSGKSSFLQVLQRDFLNSTLNSNTTGYENLVLIHFAFDQSASDEVIKMLQPITKKTFYELNSYPYRLSDDDMIKVNNALDDLKKLPLYIIEDRLDRDEILKVIENVYQANDNPRVVITMDHTLLVKSSKGDTENKLMSELAKMFNDIKKRFNALTILLGQLNDDIEAPIRKQAPNLHFPKKGDIFGSKQMYHAMSTVMVLHRPELLGLSKYGNLQTPVYKLAVLHFLKMRFGNPGIILFDEDLQHGNFHVRMKQSEIKFDE